MGRELRRKEAKKKNNTVKKEEINTEIKISTLIKLIIGTILTILILYYVVAVFITKEINISWNKDNIEENQNNTVDNRILAKNTFDQTEEKYYVYFHDFSKPNATINNLIENSELTIYSVDTNSALNKNYVTEENGNRSVTSIEELKVKSATIIEITQDKVTAYYEGDSEILSLLK